MAKKKITASKAPATKKSAGTKKKTAAGAVTSKKKKKKTAKTARTAAPAKASTESPATVAAAPKSTAEAKKPLGRIARRVAVEAEAKDPPKKSRLFGGKKDERQPIRCYLCGQRFEVSGRTMSTTCTACHKAIKVEDVQVKSYLPVNDLQTCGHIKITKRGRVAAKRIQSGRGILCEGSLEGSIESDGNVALGAKSSWKGKELQCRTLAVEDGATLNGHVRVPWERSDPDE